MQVFYHNTKNFVPSYAVRDSLENYSRQEAILVALSDKTKFRKHFLAMNQDDVKKVESAVQAVHDNDYFNYIRTSYMCLGKAVVPNTFPIRAHFNHRPKSVQGLSGYYLFDASTPITITTYPTALKSVNTSLHAADETLNGRSCYALCRPPGHHASYDYGGGYCYFNNAAIVAEYLKRKNKNVCVIDVDYHYGNGTAELCLRQEHDEEEALNAETMAWRYISLHAHPDNDEMFFFGVQSSDQDSKRVKLLPYKKITGNQWLAILESAIDEFMASRKADIFVVSLGVDVCVVDSYNKEGGLTLEQFKELGQLLAQYKVPIVFLQEEGYNWLLMGKCVYNVLDGFMEANKVVYNSANSKDTMCPLPEL